MKLMFLVVYITEVFSNNDVKGSLNKLLAFNTEVEKDSRFLGALKNVFVSRAAFANKASFGVSFHNTLRDWYLTHHFSQRGGGTH